LRFPAGEREKGKKKVMGRKKGEKQVAVGGFFLSKILRHPLSGRKVTRGRKGGKGEERERKRERRLSVLLLNPEHRPHTS